MSGDTSEIFDVYASDLTQAMQEISSLLADYPIVAIDTEFPGYFENTVQLSFLLSVRFFQSMPLRMLHIR